MDMSVFAVTRFLSHRLRILRGRCRIGLLLVALFGGGAVGGGAPAWGQSVAEAITGTDGRLLLQVNESGGLVAPGTFGVGALPVDSTGTRLLWHPAKAAFRAGRVGFGMSDGTEWNDAAMGAYSAAFGVNTEASGRGTAAFGQGAAAVGNQSVAAGAQTIARGLRSVAFGDGTTARGQFSMALGLNTTARGYGALALGRWNETRGAPSDWRGQDPLLVAGNGTGPNDRSNALLLRKNGDLTIAGTLTEHSDRRLKTNMRSLGTVSDELSQLRPIRFRFKANSGHSTTPQVGLLAQDVQAEFPHLVEEGPDGLLSLAYPRLTVVLLKGLQEQRARIDSLQRRLDKVERLAQRQKRLAQKVTAVRSSTGEFTGTEIGRLGMVGGGFLLILVGGLGGALLDRRR